MKRAFLIFAIIFALSFIVSAQTTAFNFQGRLNDGTSPANGRYDLEFRLYDAITGSGQVGATLSRANSMLVNGVFSTNLDFGATAFNGGTRFIEIGLRATGSGNAFVILGPRQQILSVPYTVRSLTATLADTATQADTATNAQKLGDIPPNGFIQNTGSVQTANLNLSGNGIFGGNVGIGVANPTQKLEVAGTTKTNILQITGGSDLAEKFGFSEAAKPGMVVAIDPRNAGKLIVARGAYNRRVAGVISGANNLAAGMILPDIKETTDSMPVALSGRVWVYCDATRNPIVPGDTLTTSNTAGYAMKITDYRRAAGATIGKAMTELKAGKGLVLVLVSLQ